MVTLERHDQLDLDLYRRIAFDHAPVAISPHAVELVDARRSALLAHLAEGKPAYGVTTGLGYFARQAVEPEDQGAFQRSILVGRAAAVGPPLSEPVVRGAMLLRLAGFLGGYAGVSSTLCRFIADRLNDRWLPVVPAGVNGVAGETVPLAHLFETFVGEGSVIVGERVTPAADALAERGAEPYALGAKEGIALINGAPLAPALSAPLAARTEALLEHAMLSAALTIALTRSSARPYVERIGRLKRDPGQERALARLDELLAGGRVLEHGTQAPVSLRVIPQVHGAAFDLLEQLNAQLARELRAVTDSPVLLEADGDEPEGLYPTGNFHAQAITLHLDALAIGCAQVLNLAEKRVHRLLDSRFSGLPDQLSADPGRQSGVVILHKQMLGLAAEARMLAAPAAIHALDASTGQEDFQAYTLLSALKLERLLTNLQLALAYEFVALRRAAELADASLPSRLQTAVAILAEFVEPMPEDRSLALEVELVADLISTGRLVPEAPRSVRLLAVEPPL